MEKINYSKIINQISLVIFAIAIAGIVLAIAGYKPIEVLIGLYTGITKDIGGTIRWTIPLILCGLAMAIPNRVGFLNLGVDGQLILGSLAATAVALYVGPQLTPLLTILLAFVAGIFVSVIWALIPGILLVKWGSNVIVVTLMLNFIATLLTDFLVLGPMRGTGVASGTDSTNTIAQEFWLPRLIPSSSANIGLFVAIIAALAVAFLVFRTKQGYELNIVGGNPTFARYGGIQSKKVILKVFVISGILAGIAGVIEILGVLHRFPRGFNKGVGFDGLVVALLAGNHPIAILFSAFFFGALRNGAINMERVTSVPRAAVDIVQGVIILFITAQFSIGLIKANVFKQKSDHKTDSIKL